ncbi:MAG TPA: hypothetical protein DEA08_16660, partial [Planctomycetes bacterium]|nr:hypothetical protein [Planctomycetota bacterium]
MYARALLPTDGSELARTVLEPLRGFLREGAAITLLTVVETEADAPAAEDSLESLRPELEAEGYEVHLRSASGAPGPAILSALRGGEFDLLAMTSHGRTGLRRIFAGSVTEEVMRESPTPLLVTTPRTQVRPRNGRLLACLDGSSRATELLPLVSSLAGQRADGHVVLLEVETFYSPEGTKLKLRSSAEVARELAPHARELNDAGVGTSIRVEVGDPAGRILRAADEEDVDAIVLCTHGRRGLLRFWTGSVAETVLRE